jgi:Mrp family chromosome partitioning ATPase
MSDVFLTPNFDNIPQELRLRPFVNWRAEGSPGEKPRKVPYVPGSPNTRASSTNPATWGSFELARACYLQGGFTGIGIILDGTGLVGVDIDHCVTSGVPDPAAMAFLENLGPGYIEFSPSGTGLRAFGYAENLQKGAKGKFNGLNVELYSTGRYLTITGKSIKSGPIAQLNGFPELAEIIRADRKANPHTGEITVTAPDEKHANLVQRILSGDGYHDSLRDSAASLISNGLHAGAAVSYLRGLMDASQAPHDERWKARRKEIPALVSSASAKFGLPVNLSGILASMRTGSAGHSGYKLLTADDLRGLPPLLWCVRGVLPAAGLAALFGPSGTGKSFLALYLAAAIASGERWFGCRVKAAPVLYICLEGKDGLSLRVQAWEAHIGKRLPEGIRMIVQSFKLTDLSNVRELAALIPSGAVVFIDTLNRAAPTADENSSRDMGEILEAAKLLQSLTGGLIVLIHHTGKDSSKGLRGHSSLFAAMDACIEVSRTDDARQWKVAKSKDGADGGSNSFDLEVVTLGIDEFGDAITSCVVVPEPDSTSPDKPLTERQLECLSTFAKAAELVGTLTNDGKFDGLHADQWREEFYSVCTVEKKGSKKTAFQRARDDLVKAGRFTADGEIYRLAGIIAGLQNKMIADAIRNKLDGGTRHTNGT